MTQLRRGAAVSSSLIPHGVNATNDEMTLASCTARAMIRVRKFPSITDERVYFASWSVGAI